MRIAFDIPDRAAAALGLSALDIAVECQGWLLGRHQIEAMKVESDKARENTEMAAQLAAEEWK